MLFTSLVGFNMFNLGYFNCFFPLWFFYNVTPIFIIDIIFHRALVAVGRGAFISSNFFIGIKVQQQVSLNFSLPVSATKKIINKIFSKQRIFPNFCKQFTQSSPPWLTAEQTLSYVVWRICMLAAMRPLSLKARAPPRAVIPVVRERRNACGACSAAVMGTAMAFWTGKEKI